VILELHDYEPPTLAWVVRNLDYSYQAEQWVIDTAAENPWVVRWVLFTDDGTPLREWQRAGGDFQEVTLTPGTSIDPRSLRRPAL
jgi:hypothetical protein